MSQAAVRDEPICGFCWMLRIRQPLIFNTEHGFWECPLCKAKTATPKTDEEKFRAALQAARESDPNRFWKMLASTRRLKHGGGRSGKRRWKRKRPVKRNREKVGCLV